MSTPIHDMVSAVDFYRGLTKRFPNTAILGGCFLSWASGQTANDWDIYVPLAEETNLISLGYRFTDLRLAGSYRKMGWRVSTDPLHGREQIILVTGEDWPPYSGFDYLHCMIGVVGAQHKIGTGIVPASRGWLISNEEAKANRSRSIAEAKAKKKTVWCGGISAEKAIIHTLDTFVSMLGGSSTTSTSPSAPAPAPTTQPTTAAPAANGTQRGGMVVRAANCYLCGTRGNMSIDSNGIPVCQRGCA